MASRAFTTRFTIACSSWPGSARTAPSAAAGLVTSSMSSPMSRCNIRSRLPTSAFRSSALVADQRVQIERAGLEHLLAAEDQQLTRQPGGPLGGLLDFLDVEASP